MQWTILFFRYLWGLKMHLWIKKISAQLDWHLRTGGWDMDEWIWDTMINDFAQNFQDIMSQEWAQKQLFELCMERGETKKGSVSNVEKRAYEVRLSQSNQPSLKWPNQRGRPYRRGPWDQRPWNQTDHSPRTSKPGTWNGTRQEGQSYPGSLHDGGFLKSSDPTAWGRVICTLKCNTVYHYWSMKIPVSF